MIVFNPIQSQVVNSFRNVELLGLLDIGLLFPLEIISTRVFLLIGLFDYLL